MLTRELTRRTLLKGGVAAGALVIGFPLVARRAVAQTPGVFAPNQWIRIDRDGIVTIVNSVPEMGQGSLTTTPMIIADELDTSLDKVRVEQAPANPALYANPITKNQSYGGSRGVRDHIETWRKSAAAARQMLKPAPAARLPLRSVRRVRVFIVGLPSGAPPPCGWRPGSADTSRTGRCSPPSRCRCRRPSASAWRRGAPPPT